MGAPIFFGALKANDDVATVELAVGEIQ